MKAIVCFIATVLVLAGCATTPKVNWSNRVGTYTYPQALAELGQPEESTVSDEGTRIATWVLQQGMPGGVEYPRPVVHGASGFTQQGIPRLRPTVLGQYLTLTFGSDGKLSSWKEDYH